MAGLFVTFEGIEGCGKTTQAARLEQALMAKGRDVVRTRQPGGTALGEKLRGILLDPKNVDIVPLTELLIYEADRAQHVERTIRPALAAGRVVICDRYGDASVAYQGAARGLGAERVAELNRIATGGLAPDVTIVLDLEPKIALARVAARGAADRLEREALDFHARVRDGYLAIAKTEPARVKVIAADRDADAIARDVLAAVEPKLG